MTHRIFCDFNKRVDADTYGLNTIGSRADIARLPEPLAVGMRLELADEDVLDNGDAVWLVADAIVVALPDGQLAAQADPASFRWERRNSPGEIGSHAV